MEAYKEYKQCKQNVEDSLMMLEEESDEEMRELAKEELNDSKARIEELERELKIVCFCRKTRTMRRTLFWRSARAQAERGGAVRCGSISDVCALCGEPQVESGDDLVK